MICKRYHVVTISDHQELEKVDRDYLCKETFERLVTNSETISEANAGILAVSRLELLCAKKSKLCVDRYF